MKLGQIIRFALVAVAMLGAVWAAPASAHGCHSHYEQSQGWHNHGKECKAR